MAKDKITVVVENHQSGNRQFPGLKKKYPDLFNIPGESIGKKAMVIEIDAEDLEQIQADMLQNGVVVRDYESLDEDSKGMFGRWFSKVFGSKEDGPAKDEEDKNAELLKTWRDLFGKLNKQQKANFKGDPKKASIEDLQANIAEATEMLKPEK